MTETFFKPHPKPAKRTKKPKSYWVSKAYRKWMKGQICLACGASKTEDGYRVIDGAHQAFESTKYHKSMGMKYPDSFMLPLCRCMDGNGCHPKQESMTMAEFWGVNYMDYLPMRALEYLSEYLAQK